MSNHTIATPITTWAAARTTDREVLNRAEVATLLSLDPRTIDHAIADGTIPAVHVGRCPRSAGEPRHRCSPPTPSLPSEVPTFGHRMETWRVPEGRRASDAV